MISGSLNAEDLPIVSIRLRGPFGSATIETIVDTGFGGNFTVPITLVHSLGLPRAGVAFHKDVRGSVILSNTYDCQIYWNGDWRDIEAVQSLTGFSLGGSRLMRGHKLIVDYGPARSVEIE